MGSTVFRNPRALSSALAVLGTLQPRALGFLNTVDPLDTVSNYYVYVHVHVHDQSVIETRQRKATAPEDSSFFSVLFFQRKKMSCLRRDLNP